MDTRAPMTQGTPTPRLCHLSSYRHLTGLLTTGLTAVPGCQTTLHAELGALQPEKKLKECKQQQTALIRHRVVLPGRHTDQPAIYMGPAL